MAARSATRRKTDEGHAKGGKVVVKAHHADVYQTKGGEHAWYDDEGKQSNKRVAKKHGGALSRVAAHTSKGGLHRSLGIPEGQKIGAKRIAEATHSENPKTRRQARLAQTYAAHRPS